MTIVYFAVTLVTTAVNASGILALAHFQAILPAMEKPGLPNPG